MPLAGLEKQLGRRGFTLNFPLSYSHVHADCTTAESLFFKNSTLYVRKYSTARVYNVLRPHQHMQRRGKVFMCDDPLGLYIM